jgi:hypothetical protein
MLSNMTGEKKLVDKIANILSIRPSEYEREFIDVVIYGGKSDPSEKASVICCFFEKDNEENRKAIYDILTSHWEK